MIRLPKKILKLFILAGLIFLLGAVGMEAIGGYHVEGNGIETLTYTLIYSLEEIMEMSGAAIFIYALLNYMEIKFETLQFSFGTNDI